MAYNTGVPLVNSVLDAIDKNYVGLLDESDTSLEVFNLTGSVDALFVQTIKKNALTSGVIAKYNAATEGFQRFMVNTSGLSLVTVGSKSIVGSNVGNPISLELDTKPYFTSTATTRQGLKYILPDPEVYTPGWTSLFGKSLDADLFPAVGVSPLPGYASMVMAEKYVYEVCKGLGAQPRICILITPITTNFTTAFTETGGYWDGQLELSPSAEAYKKFPCIPGFSRVFTCFSYGSDTNFGAYVCCTYIPGSCDVDHYYLEQFFNNYNGSNGVTIGDHYVVSEGKLINNYGDSAAFSKYAAHVPIASSAPGFGLSFAQLDAACKINVRSLRLNANKGVLLFGPPKADVVAVGTSTIRELTVQSPSGKTIDITLVDCKTSEFNWTLSKDWYKEYMNTGFGVFTPRASNIRANVLKAWDTLPYNLVTIRGTSTPYTTDYTVSKLPEAISYGRAREKACKTNDWLDKVAVPDQKMTWRQLGQLETSRRGRTLWMNSSDAVVHNSATTEYDKAQVVSYSRNATTGVITRQDALGTTTLNLSRDDDIAEIVQDYYFNKSASFTGITSDLFSLSPEEKSALSDAQLNLTTNPQIGQRRQVVGFGAWIDATGRADVSNISEEQKYRLHITNSLYYDKMMGPLKKVIESFGYLTLVKFI